MNGRLIVFKGTIHDKLSLYAKYRYQTMDKAISLLLDCKSSLEVDLIIKQWESSYKENSYPDVCRARDVWKLTNIPTEQLKGGRYAKLTFCYDRYISYNVKHYPAVKVSNSNSSYRIIEFYNISEYCKFILLNFRKNGCIIYSHNMQISGFSGTVDGILI